nr:MAG: Zn finger protein [uncultured archaeon]
MECINCGKIFELAKDHYELIVLNSNKVKAFTGMSLCVDCGRKLVDKAIAGFI